MDEPSLSDRVMAWRRVLSPWIAALWGRLTIELSDMPQRDDLERNLWIRFAPDDKSDNQLAWLQWLEAFELLDILASRDSRACWDILLDLSNSKNRLPSLGCPQDLFYGLRPRYETTFEFRTNFFPREGVAGLVSTRIKDQEHTSEYAVAKTELLALDGPRIRSPIQLRWHFPIYASYVDTDPTERARYKGRLKHVLSLATVASTSQKKVETVYELASVGLPQAVHHSNEAREIVQRIACAIPVSSTTLNEPLEADQFKTNFYGPFLWRLLAPQSNRRTHLGIQKLVIASSQLWRDANVGAVGSAIAHSRTLRELSFTGSNHHTWAPWLGFALFSKTATHSIETVRLTFPMSAPKKYLDALRRITEHPNPVAYMAAVQDGDGTAQRLVKWAPTTVRMNAQAKIYVHDHLRSVTTVYHGKQDAVCHVADSNDQFELVRVLIPGVGFGRVHRRDLLGPAEPTATREAHAVRSLVLTLYHTEVAHFTEFLALVGAPLTTLALMASGNSRGKALRLTEILAHCPNLKRLSLNSLTIHAETLLPSRHARNLESLTLRACTVTSDPKYTLCITPRMAPQLSSFCATLSCTSSGMDLRALALALLSTGRIERFVLACRGRDAAEKAHIEADKQHVARSDGQKFPAVARRVKLAVLSALTTRPRVALCNEIVSRIFEMVAAPVQRRCCTLVVS